MKKFVVAGLAGLLLNGCINAKFNCPDYKNPNLTVSAESAVGIVRSALPREYSILLDSFQNNLQCSEWLEEDNKVLRADLSFDDKVAYIELKKYIFLARLGASKETLERITQEDVPLMAEYFKSENAKPEFIHKFGQSQDFVRYSKDAAESDADFVRGPEWAQSAIVDRLKDRPHASRWDTDYDESAEQLSKVRNPHVLYLIKQYVEFFDSKESKVAASKLFAKDKSEHGGLFFHEAGKLLLLNTPNFAKEMGLNPEHTFAPAKIQAYVPNLGLIHSHRLHEGVYPPSSPGPSGYAKNMVGHKHNLHFDTGFLKSFHQFNPYSIDVVASELEGNKFNVDLYFQDVAEVDGQPTSVGDVVVIDIGVYELK